MISIISVHYNNPKILIDSINFSLKKINNTIYEYIIVDNNSTIENIDVIEKFIKENKNYNIRLVKSIFNYGFGDGCNKGAEIAIGEILWFLNSDAWIIKFENLKILKKKILDNKSGLVGTVVIDENIGLTPQGGSDMSFVSLLLSSFRLGKLYRSMPEELQKLINYFTKKLSINENYISSLDYFNLDFKESIGISGASFLIEKKKFFEIGGFDRNFFLYDEDADLSLRLYKDKFINHITNLIHVKTITSSTTSNLNSIELKKIKKKSRIYFINKHFFGVKKYILILITNITWRLF